MSLEMTFKEFWKSLPVCYESCEKVSEQSYNAALLHTASICDRNAQSTSGDEIRNLITETKNDHNTKQNTGSQSLLGWMDKATLKPQ